MTTMTMGGRHWSNDVRADPAIAVLYVAFALRWLLGLESRAAVGKHARRNSRAPGWAELTIHYLVAAATWVRGWDERNAEYGDESALSRTGRVVLALVVLTVTFGLPWLLGGDG